MQHSTSSGVWCEMLKMIKKKSSVSVSGPEVLYLCSKFNPLDVWI